MRPALETLCVLLFGAFLALMGVGFGLAGLVVVAASALFGYDAYLLVRLVGTLIR